jgi:hypothetical protein
VRQSQLDIHLPPSNNAHPIKMKQRVIHKLAEQNEFSRGAIKLNLISKTNQKMTRKNKPLTFGTHRQMTPYFI